MSAATEHVDVLIVGAGLSGIGAGCHLRTSCPDKTFAILESRDAIGGTWDLFRYPGIRSDSDMFTLGYPFRPWPEAEAIADGPSIRSYVRDTAGEYGLEETIRFHQRVVAAEWSTKDARWTVDVERTDTHERVQLTCGFLFMCTGYYRYDEGYTPHFEGTERFRGQIVHPQHWPEDLDYAGKRVTVIGSGATAVTLVPAMADEAAHVTMVQRSPSYVVSLPGTDPIATLLRRVLPRKAAFEIVRWKNVLLPTAFFLACRRWPKAMKGLIRRGVMKRLPDGYDVDTHFAPRYQPWDQRLCLVPDGDLFETISAGRASVVTDRIETFTENGLQLESGSELVADVIVTATGLNMLMLGGMRIAVDGRDIKLNETVGYKGMMLSGVPNLAVALGYTNASWTLKCDLVTQYVCRLLNHMDANGHRQATPRAPDQSVATEPFLDLASGYVLRSIHTLPKQGSRAPWRLYQNYMRDVLMMRRGPLEDEGIEFSNPGAPANRRAAGRLVLGRDLALDDVRLRGHLAGYQGEYLLEVLCLEDPLLRVNSECFLGSDLPEIARPADEPHLPVRDLEAGDVPVRERATAGVEVARRRDGENLVRPAHARLRILELGTDEGRGGSVVGRFVQRLLEVFYRPGRGRVRDALGEHGTVRVAGDHHEAAGLAPCPLVHRAIVLRTQGEVARRRRGRVARLALQRPPDMSDEQPGGKPEPVAVGGALVAVHEEQRAWLLAGTVHG